MTVTNFTYLNEISGKDEAFIKSLIRLFLEEVPELLNQLSTAYATADFEQIAFHAHKLNSSLKILGTNTLSFELVYIQDKAKTEKNLAKLTPHIEKVQQITQEILDELQDLAN